MKRLLTLSLALAAVLAVQGADTIFRVDMESKKDQIVLNVEKDDDLKATNFGWGKADERKYTQSIAFREKVPSTEWKDYDFSFIPSKSGKVNISIGAQWAKTPAERQWVLVNKMELTRLQRNFEACAAQITQLEKEKTSRPAILALTVGIIGTAFMAGATFAVTAEPPLIALCIVLAVPGFLGWILPYFLYKNAVRRQTEKITPLIEEKYDEIYEICEKGSKLL